MQKIEPLQNLTDRVAEALRNDIFGGSYEVGEGLQSEAEMAKNFGVSRTVMREAVSRLKADGLLVSKQGAGIFVRAIQPKVTFQIESTLDAGVENILPIVELRLGFEVEAAGLAALRATPEQLADIRSALDVMTAAGARGDLKGAIEADVDFHHKICVATGNPYYPQLFDTFRNFLLENIKVSRDRSARHLTNGGPAHSEHAALFEAISTGDEVAARASARSHIENTRTRLVRSLGSPQPDQVQLRR